MKTALVLEGGASRGMFSCGVMDALIDNGICANYVIGTSAGIANGASYVSGQRGRSLRIGTKYYSDKRYMGMKHLLNPFTKSYYNIKFVFDDIPNKYDLFDYDAFDAFQGDVIACVTNISTGNAEYLPVTSDDRAWKTIVASCSLPILFQPVELKGNLYMDGGMSDSIPYKKAIEDGCDRVIVVLTRERDYIKDKEPVQKLIGIMYRKYPHLIERIANRHLDYNKCRDELFALESEGGAFVIAPEDTKEFNRVEKQSDNLQKLYNQGYDITTKNIDKLKEYLGI